MKGATIRVQGNGAHRGVFTVAKDGAVTHDSGRVITESDVTFVVNHLAGAGWATEAGQVQGWWWRNGPWSE